MARRLLLALTIAVVISGAFTFWLAHIVFASSSHLRGQFHYVAVKHAVDAGEVLTADDLQMVNWPGHVPLLGAFSRMEDVTGRAALYPLATGEPILDRHLQTAGAGLSGHIPNGMRAISLKSNEVVGVAGYLLPGSHVDVLVTLLASGSHDPVTTTVLQDVQVLTAGQKMQPDPEGKATRVDVVTLLVSPEDAGKVVLASTQGTLHFVLRNGGDHTRNAAPETRLSELSSQQPEPQPVVQKISIPHPAPHVQAAKVEPHYSVEVLRGDKQSVETF